MKQFNVPQTETISFYGEAKVQETWMDGEGFKTLWRDVRPIPEDDDFFENIWRSYRKNQNTF